MSLFDKIKQKAEDLGLPEKAGQVQEAATKAAAQAKEKAGDFAEQNKDKVAGALDKATQVIDEKTDGKYHDKVAKATGAVAKGVDKVAEGSGRQPGTPEGKAPDTAPEPEEWQPPSGIPPVDPL
ncbi:MAG: antitoxin [Dermatophilaceae bacterium]